MMMTVVPQVTCLVQRIYHALWTSLVPQLRVFDLFIITFGFFCQGFLRFQNGSLRHVILLSFHPVVRTG